MVKINVKDSKNINPNSGIQVLLVEGSNPLLLAMDWTKQNDYRFLSVADVYNRSGLEGIQGVKLDQIQFRQEIEDERKYGWKSPMRVEGYTLFNSYFLSQRNIENISELPNEEFDKMGWFNFYIAHNPTFKSEDIQQIGDSSSIIVSKGLESKFNLQELSDVFKFSGAPWHDIAWLEGDLTKADSYLHEKLFGKPVENYKNKIEGLGHRKSIILSCPLPSMELKANPVEFGTHTGYSFSDHPFWYKATEEDKPGRVDRVHVIPIMKNKLYHK